MKIQLRLPWRRATVAAVDPGRPHTFRRINDPGIVAMAAGNAPGGGYGTAAPLAMTDNYVRKQRCGVPGCGRAQYDPIHRDPDD
jgi:hypothetical protein